MADEAARSAEGGVTIRMIGPSAPPSPAGEHAPAGAPDSPAGGGGGEAERDLAAVRDFYRSLGYANQAEASDRILLAEEGDAGAGAVIVGVVRLASELGVVVLRGMRVAPSHQRRGIGLRLLQAVRAALGNQACYCIPYPHLIGFYGRIGFVEVDPSSAPIFLAERLADYRRRRRSETFTLMLRAGTAAAADEEVLCGRIPGTLEG